MDELAGDAVHQVLGVEHGLEQGDAARFRYYRTQIKDEKSIAKAQEMLTKTYSTIESRYSWFIDTVLLNHILVGVTSKMIEPATPSLVVWAKDGQWVIDVC